MREHVRRRGTLHFHPSMETLIFVCCIDVVMLVVRFQFVSFDSFRVFEFCAKSARIVPLHFCAVCCVFENVANV